jgi:hypothetical protein
VTGAEGGSVRVALVPGVLALLPEHAGLVDPVADLRRACHDAVAWLGADVTVLAGGTGLRVAEHLLTVTAGDREARAAASGSSYLVVGNGTATRTEKAPGHLDERSHPFDDALREALLHDREALRRLDLDLAAELWADVAQLVQVPDLVGADAETLLDHDADPYGVQYWVVRWSTPA